MGCAGIKAEVRDVKEYEVGLEVCPMGRCFGRVKDDNRSSDHSELATKGLWRSGAYFRGAMSLTLSAYSKWSIFRLSVKALT